MNGYQHLGIQQPLRDRGNSPLRNKEQAQRPVIQTTSGLRQPNNFNQKDEEEEYEKRRQEELRKQMQTRDYDSGGPMSSSLLKSGYGSDSYNSGKSYQNIPERENVSNTHFTLGPQIRNEQEVPSHVKEHISNIQSDNSSLMRRLNLVMQELERVNREKEDIFQRLKQSAKEGTELQRLINGEDNVDKVNNYMSDDLVYERDSNHKIKQQIKELDVYRSELLQELRKIQDRSDGTVHDNQQQSISLNQKLMSIQDLEKEHYFTQEKIKQLNNTIEIIKTELMEANSDKIELQQILNQLITDRNDLLSRLDHLTRKYDECVREISHDRAEMEAHNKQHAKLITAKIIFQQLNQMHKQRFIMGFQKFKEYCNFDNKCHSKLSNFAKILEKTGHYRMRIGLRQWFSMALMPLKTKQQSKLLVIKLDSQKLELKMFIKWKNAYDTKVKQYELKNQAVQRIWNFQCKDIQIETKRSFLIWKEALERFRLQKTRVKKIIWKQYFNKLSQAMNTWQSHVADVDTQVRLTILSQQFSQKQYLTILFNSFRLQVSESKRKRINILFHCLKAWKDHLMHQKFLMCASVSALHFRRNCDESILKQCFDALRLHKESERFLRVDQLLNQQELSLISNLNEENEDFEVQRKFKAKQKACESVKKMVSKQLYGYIQRWKQVNENYKETLRTTLKDKIIKVYMDKMRQAFTYWNSLHNENKLTQQQMVISEFQSDSSNIQNEVLDLQKDVQSRKEQLDCSQSKHVLKCVTSYQKRLKQLAVGRWRDQIQSISIKEDGAETIIKRLRLRYLRQAFDLYLGGVKYKKKLLVEEERCALYHKIRNERLKKQVLNAWIIFNNHHLKAKKYWYRMYIKLDLGMKQIALKRWREWSQKQVESEMIEKQNEVAEQIEDLNHQIGNLHQDATDQQMQIVSIKKQMTTQAQRIISNAFVRFYYVSETRGFEKWKEHVQFEKNKERIFKKCIDHMRKQQFYMVKSTFQNWMINSDIQERKDLLKKEEMKVADSNLQVDLQTKQFAGMKSKLTDQIQETTQLQNMYNTRLQKSVQMIINRVDNNDHMSQKRYILIQWRTYVKREVNFIKCIQNVIQKSLWNKAFIQIRECSRQGQKDDHLDIKLNRFRQKFWKRTCGNAFSVWRSGQFTMITQVVEELEQNQNQVIEDYQNKKALFKDTNITRSERILNKNNLKNLFQSWKNVIQFLKFHNAKNDQFIDSTQTFQKKMALFKWNSRKNATKLARLRTKRLKEKFHQLRLRQYFTVLKSQYFATKEFCTRMANLAKIHDHQALKLSLNGIISFAKAKGFVHQTRKSNASSNIQSIIQQLVIRKKQQYLNDLRVRSLNSKKENMIKSFTILHNIGNKMRHFFLKWRDMSNERTLALEMHDEGPVRAEVFEAKVTLKNLKAFMSTEGYDNKEIEEAINSEKLRQAVLTLKSVRRMQHYNEELYTKPMMFDRWKQYVQLKKLFRYWLDYTAKRSEYIKSDLHFAFDKWKNYQSEQFKALSRLNKDQLDKRMLQNNKKLDLIADNVQEKEDQLDHLENQREALVENYVKGQKLALSLWVNYRRKWLHQGFLRWYKIIRTEKNIESLENLKQNMELIDKMKNRINSLEDENETLANENEDLRQFSLDGYEIAKNVQALTSEREKLSVDLADKAQVIRRLLDENDKLTSKLRAAQEEAQNLIKSTMAGSSGFKSGMKGNPSPLSRSYY